MTELKKSINIFLLDENLEDFIKNDERESPIEELDSKLVYLIVDPTDKIVWIWNGAETNIRMKFIATQKAPLIRDEYGIDFKIIGVDENEEPTEFKDFLGLD